MNAEVLAIADKAEDADADLIAQVKAAKETDRQTWSAFSKAADVKEGTLTSWMSGNYNAGKRPAEMVAKLEVYLETRASRLEKDYSGPGFVETPTAEAIFTILKDAQFGPDMVSISGEPGVGKTLALREYKKHHSNVWTMTMRPSLRSAGMMMIRLGEVMEVEEKVQAKVTDRVGVRVENSGGLIIFDEAQHLVEKQLDEIRYIHDEYNIGIALIGNLALHGQIIGGKAGSKRKPAFAQLYSRLGFRTIISKPDARDIDAIIAAWDIDDAATEKVLHKIAQKAGGLREMVKTIKSASKAARGLGKPLDADLVRAAWAHRDQKED